MISLQKASAIFLVLFIFLMQPVMAADSKITNESQLKSSKTSDSINIENDQEIVNLKKEIEAQNKEDMSKIISSSLSELNGEKNDVRTGETNLGDLIADAIKKISGANLALINSKAIQASIPAGLISIGDVRKALPAKDQIIVKEISGSQLCSALEYSLSRYPEPAGSFPQVSGVRIIFTLAKSGQAEILKVLINGEKILADKSYLLATNDFIARGGDGFEMLAQAETVKEVGRLDQIFINYLADQEIIRGEKQARVIELQNLENGYAYQVQKGDTLSNLATKFATTVKNIMELNQLQHKNLIYAGQNLLIPDLIKATK